MSKLYLQHDYAVTGRDYVDTEGGDTPAGGLTFDLLFTGSTSSSAELTAEYTNYKMLLFYCYNSNFGGNMSSIYPCGDIVLNQNMILGSASTTGQDRRLIGKLTDATHITITTAENNSVLAAVYGIK